MTPEREKQLADEAGRNTVSQYNMDATYTRVGNVVTISGSILLGNDAQQHIRALKLKEEP